jgi:hypothetical protein
MANLTGLRWCWYCLYCWSLSGVIATVKGGCERAEVFVQRGKGALPLLFSLLPVYVPIAAEYTVTEKEVIV